LTEKQPALVVAPSTLLQNWQREINRFAPTLRAAIYHGGARNLAQITDTDIIITSYSHVRSDVSILEKQKWLALVIDEAQQIKNPAAAQTKAVKKIKAQFRIAMSGTPVENRLSEYWSVFDYANQSLLGTGVQFKKEFAVPIEAERNLQVLNRFHEVTKPFVLRRLKTDKSIISDLPDKIEQNQYCAMSPLQVSLYKAQVDAAMQKIEEADGVSRRGQVLALMMALKQICNHPAQFLKKGKADPELGGKCEHLLSLIETAIGNDEKVLVFTQFREMGELLVELISNHIGQTVPFLHGGVTLKKRTEMVDAFQGKHRPSVLIISLKAGGTGLNLTAASQVIHYDLWWNLAVEAQATDRAFRIGQKKNVLVNRFITQGSFEEKIDALMQSKKDLANLTVTSGETWIGDLSNADLRKVFTL
jgi:SNF2 family DNA or RNA helicase